jgi:ribosomal protein S18 acetylase RimI-like enzyme
VRALCVHDPEALIAAESEDEIVGSVIAGFDGWRGNLYRLAVHPKLRRQGLARALVAEAEGRLAARGAKRITALVVAEHSDAKS